MFDRRKLLVLGVSSLLVSLVGCAGPSSKLRTLSPGGGSGPPEFAIGNQTSVTVNNLYMAETAAINAAGRVEPGTPEQQDLWGPDLLVQGALEVGGEQQLSVKPGRYDVRALDADGREQRVTGIKLAAGGKYVLELADGGWKAPLR